MSRAPVEAGRTDHALRRIPGRRIDKRPGTPSPHVAGGVRTPPALRLGAPDVPPVPSESTVEGSPELEDHAAGNAPDRGAPERDLGPPPYRPGRRRPGRNLPGDRKST